MSSVEPEAGLIGTSTGLQAEECCDQMVFVVSSACRRVDRREQNKLERPG